MVTFPDLASYHILVVDHRAETTAMIAAIFGPTRARLTVAGTIEVAERLMPSLRPDVVLLATAMDGGPFVVVEAARRHGIPIVVLDLGSAGPEISRRLARAYGVAVLDTVDDPEALCLAAKRAADEKRRAPRASAGGSSRLEAYRPGHRSHPASDPGR